MVTPATNLQSIAAAPKERRVRTKNKKGLFAGWISEEHRIAWVVSPHRADKTTGAVERNPPSAYAQELMASVTLGNIPWRKATEEDVTEVALEVWRINVEPKTYWLHYTRRAKGGRGKYNRPQFEKIIAFDDTAAWDKALEFLQRVGAAKESIERAELFDSDREVTRPDGQLATKEKGKLVRKPGEI